MSTRQKGLTDRLAKVEKQIQAANDPKIESNIVWSLIGIISYWGRHEGERGAQNAKWLLDEIEFMVEARQKIDEGWRQAKAGNLRTREQVLDRFNAARKRFLAQNSKEV